MKIDCRLKMKEMKWKICLVVTVMINIKYAEFWKTADAKSV